MKAGEPDSENGWEASQIHSWDDSTHQLSAGALAFILNTFTLDTS